MGFNSNIIEVYADFIYYVIIGEKKSVDYIKNILSSEKVETYVEYLCLKASVPIAKHRENIEKYKQIEVQLDPIVEEAHACAYSSCDMKNSFMIVCLKIIENNYILTFPRYVMVDGDDPEKGLINEFSRLSKNKLTALLASTIRPYDVIGSNKDTILYLSILKSKGTSNDNSRLDHLIKFLAKLDGGIE